MTYWINVHSSKYKPINLEYFIYIYINIYVYIYIYILIFSRFDRIYIQLY